LREFKFAIQYLQLVLENARKDRNRLDEANALGNLANVYSARDKPEAIRLAEQAKDIYQQLGYRHWAAQTLASSGLWRVEIGESTDGIKLIEEAISILREIEDRRSEVSAVGQLGEAYMSLNDPHQAIKAFDEQLRIAHEIGDRHREANALGDKGIMLASIGELDLAMIAFNEARHVAQLTGNLGHEFKTLCKAGEAYAKAGKRDEVIKTFEDQVVIARSMEIVSEELHALKHLADLFIEEQDYERAKGYMEARVSISKPSRDKHDYPQSQFELSQFYANRGEYGQAIAQAETAANLFGHIPCPSHALEVRQQIHEWNNYRAAST
jgi:tetratricopeptide (TPR) repeat protein